MNLDDAKVTAMGLREGGAGDGEILMALTRGGLTARDAEDIVKDLPGKNRSSVKRVGAFDLREWKFGALVALVLVPLVTLYFGGGLRCLAALFGVASLLFFVSGANRLRRYLRGEATALVDVRPHFMGIPMPFTVATHPAAVALSHLCGGVMFGYLSISISMLR